MSLPAIVLAAGASRRLGQAKQLLKFGGETLLERAIRLARQAGAAPIWVVLGAQHSIIAASVSLPGAIGVFNPDWEQGLSTSIHAGLRALGAGAAGTLILSCDQPRLSADHLRALIAAFAGQTEPAIVASAYAGKRGVPAVFPRAVFPHLLALRGDTGARDLLREPPCPLVAIDFPGGEVDIDTPGDLAERG